MNKPTNKVVQKNVLLCTIAFTAFIVAGFYANGSQPKAQANESTLTQTKPDEQVKLLKKEIKELREKKKYLDKILKNEVETPREEFQRRINRILTGDEGEDDEGG